MNENFQKAIKGLSRKTPVSVVSVPFTTAEWVLIADTLRSGPKRQDASTIARIVTRIFDVLEGR